MAEIPLTQGLTATVDDDDYERVAGFKWFAHRIGRSVYAGRDASGETVHMHRFLLDFPDGYVDHIDGDGLNNQRSNIRVCTPRENSLNRKKYEGTSKHRGVYWHASTKRWMARITSHGKTYYLGQFQSEKAAALAYKRAARRIFQDFAGA